MDDEVQALLAQRRYRDAAGVLDERLGRNRDDDQLWYLRGVVSLKLKSYDFAREYFERALFIRRKPEYLRMKGMAHFEIFELEEAIEAFTEALAIEPKDVQSEFLIAICYMLMDDPRSDKHLKRAQGLDARRTGQLLSNFYSFFIAKDPRVGAAQKKRIEEKIKSIRK
jgi:tetratricopeptide (TPR) repeat protein